MKVGINSTNQESSTTCHKTQALKSCHVCARRSRKGWHSQPKMLIWYKQTKGNDSSTWLKRNGLLTQCRGWEGVFIPT